MDEITAVRAAVRLVLRERAVSRPMLSDWRRLLSYLRVDLAHHHREQVRALYLDARNVLIVEDVVSEGTIDQASVHVREIVARALEVGAAGVVLVHNHPSGDVNPTMADVTLTRAVVRAAEVFDITIHDHLIIGRAGHVSLRARGFI